jgi:two-component system sensor histidine kinase/response regulator
MEILDRRLLLDNVAGDRELLAEIVTLFLENSRDLLAGLHEAADSGDAEAIHRKAHQLKGALANLGAQAAAESACRLETAGRDKRLEGVPDAVRQLEEEMERLGPELASLVESGSE